MKRRDTAMSRSPRPAATSSSKAARRAGSRTGEVPVASAMSAAKPRSFTMYRAMPLGESSPVMSFSRRLSSSRDPAYPPDSSDHNASRSRPERSASTVASPSAMIVAETTSWLQALATSPAPSGPSRTGVPQGASTSAATAASSGAPPSMIERVPAIAPSSPPETGQSTTRTRPSVWSETRSANARTAGAEEVKPMRMSRSPASASSPSGPSSMASNGGRSGSIMSRTSTLEASSRGVCAQEAPAASSSGCGRRAWMTSRPCAASRWSDMGRPMAPRPTTPTVADEMVMRTR